MMMITNGAIQLKANRQGTTSGALHYSVSRDQPFLNAFLPYVSACDWSYEVVWNFSDATLSRHLNEPWFTGLLQSPQLQSEAKITWLDVAMMSVSVLDHELLIRP